MPGAAPQRRESRGALNALGAAQTRVRQIQLDQCFERSQRLILPATAAVASISIVSIVAAADAIHQEFIGDAAVVAIARRLLFGRVERRTV
jgi:hypothetical protein